MIKKILIVDDDPTQCALVCQLVEKKMVTIGAKADCLHNLDDARARLKVNNVSLILLDLCFNGVAGPTIAFIREAAREGLPIIITTGTTIFDSDLLSQCLVAGAQTYWIKGSPFDELIQKMGVILERTNPDSGGAKIAVQAFRAAPKHFWEFPFSENFGAKLAVLLTIVTLAGAAWTCVAFLRSGIEKQDRDKFASEQRIELAKTTAATVALNTKQIGEINESFQGVIKALGQINATLDLHTSTISAIRDDVIKGIEQRNAIKERVDRLDNGSKDHR